MKKALDLEEEASKVPQLKAQLDDYKQNLASLKVQALSASGNHEQQMEVYSSGAVDLLSDFFIFAKAQSIARG
jgi:hypothetical protein